MSDLPRMTVEDFWRRKGRYSKKGMRETELRQAGKGIAESVASGKEHTTGPPSLEGEGGGGHTSPDSQAAPPTPEEG